MDFNDLLDLMITHKASGWCIKKYAKKKQVEF